MRLRFSGLDGLRGIAVLIVVLYHAGIWQLPGGFLGVDIFFVLSGFLITSLLLAEVQNTNTIDRANFYLRRLRRIMPALIAVLLFSIFAAALWAPDAGYGVRRDLPWALTSVLNWSYLFFNQSYFVNISRPPLLGHLWSLSIEEQYYVIWPLVILLFTKLKWIKRRIRLSVFLLATIGAIASTIWMRLLAIRNGYPIPHDPSRLYFGTDTHAMGLLVGSALAALVRPEGISRKLTPDRKTLLNLLATGSLTGLGYFIFLTNELTESLFRGGFLIVALCTAGLIFSSIHPTLIWGKLLDVKPLRWLGLRSYGIYLWHWPIFIMLRPGVDTSWPEQVVFFVRITLTILISALSYRYLEVPIRNGSLKQTWIRWQSLGVPKPSIFKSLVLLTMLFGLLASSVVVAKQPMPDAANDPVFNGVTAIDSDPTPVSPVATLIPTVTATASASTSPNTSSTPKPPSGAMPVKHGKVVVFGDSVVLSGRFALQATLKSVSIDAAVGRQPWEIADRIKLRRKQGRLSNFVVIHMGTNGLVTRNDLAPILNQLRDRKRVVVVDVQVPRVWMRGSNQTIYALLKDYPNVRLASWRLASKGHPGYFTPDGVHLQPPGARIFAKIIRDALSQS
ncbi:MAG: acyltransferase [Actinomycetales bacterium]|nr:acyltransferase [Actinomycetales bacterium]